MRELIKLRTQYIVIIVIVLCIFVTAGSGINNSILAAGTSSSKSDSTFWYYVDSEKIYLPLATDAVTIVFDDNLTNFERNGVTEDINELAPRAALRGITQPELAFVELITEVDQTDLLNLLNDLQAQPGIRQANPVFALPNARLTMTDRFITRFKPHVQMEDVEVFNKVNNVEIVMATRLPNTFILRVGAGLNTLDVANLYHESDITIYATPDFVRSLDRQFIPNDALFPGQWGLENTGTNPPDGVGTADADIDASAAWDVALGDPGTVIAIIDEGVELNHEDLNDKIVSQYSAIPGDSNANPNNTWDAHGTNCAGIATAETNNSQGVAGVCPNCSLMPVQIAYSLSDGGSWITVDSWIADAIIWSVDNGADVLSNSWGGGTPSSLINDAITYAITNGRGGSGSVLLFAAGNGNINSVIYPASNNNTIAVGASSPCDERKNPSSCDGESWWGSNYGSQLDIVSPGVEWWSTDLMGAAGYSSGNYFNHMNGTSSATPAVAGLAGLIISHRPCLNKAQVQEIIELSADDQVGLPGEDTPGWDQFMGWGRINAHQALLLANNYSCGQDPHLEVTPENQTVTSAAGTTRFDVSANVDWTVAESEDWLSVTPTSGSGDATLSVTYGENFGTSQRIGTITVSDGTLSGEVTVTQTDVDTFTLEYAAGAGGSLTGDTSQVVAYGEDGTAVEAVPDLGYQFVDWSDGSTANPRTDTNVTADVDVTAKFDVIPSSCYTLIFSHTGQGSDPIGLPANSNGCAAGKFGEGETINLSGAVPDSGWEISGWTGTDNDGRKSSTNTVTMPANDHAVYVIYKIVFYFPIIFI